MSEQDDIPEPQDIEALRELMAANQPPQTLTEAMRRFPNVFQTVKNWKRDHTAAIIGGLTTELSFQPNAVRLDWLMRANLALAEGKQKVSKQHLTSLLNNGFGAAQITRLEDPIEDVFVDFVPTERGEFSIFTGHFENASAHTQTVIEAFENLPPHPAKDRALKAAYALLTLSTELVKRSGLVALKMNDGAPKENMRLPSTEKLRKLGQRVTFSETDLSTLGISMVEILQFCLHNDLREDVLTRVTGDSLIDLAPLIETPNGIIVFNPAAISLAVRGILLKAVKEWSLDQPFLRQLMQTQLAYTNATQFWPGGDFRLLLSDRHLMRASILQFAPGRYLQVIQVMTPLDYFPQHSFGGLLEMHGTAREHLTDLIDKFWAFLAEEEDYRESQTLLLMSTWGCGIAVEASDHKQEKPKNWQFLALPYAAAATLGACEGGKLVDIWRIIQQQRTLESSGFEFVNASGFLNIFGFYKDTNGQLVPEHGTDIEPPARLLLPTNSLLDPRIEGKSNQGLRALPTDSQGYKIVQRVNRGPDGLHKNIFGSLDDIRNKRLIGAVQMKAQTVWVECRTQPDQRTGAELQYQIWNAALEWLNAISDKLMAWMGELSGDPISIRIELVSDFDLELDDFNADLPAHTYLSTKRSEFGQSIEVFVSRGWTQCLMRVENDAEAALVAAIVSEISNFSDAGIDRNQATAWLINEIGSKDWRWLHAKPAEQPAQRLAASGILQGFRTIPRSALSLAKTNSVWRFHARVDGSRISGVEACGKFFQRYNTEILNALIEEIRRFDRTSLIQSALRRYNAGRAEHETWRNTFLAMKTIEGEDAHKLAFDRQNEIFGTQRAAKAVSEIAACEAPLAGGLEPSKYDLDELLALALLLLGNGHLHACVKTGFIDAEIAISPSGDLLADRTFFQKALVPSAEASTAKNFESAAQAYLKRTRDEEPEPIPDRLAWDPELRTAIEAEYGCEAEGFVDLQHVLSNLAIEQGKDVLLIRRSELISMLSADENFFDTGIENLIDRLTLPSRKDWFELTVAIVKRDVDVWQFDRAHSLINRPLIALNDDDDRLLAISPIMLSETTMYSISGLYEGRVQGEYWSSPEARRYAGRRADIEGRAFEDEIVAKLESIGLSAKPRQKLSKLLDDRLPSDLGDIDVFCSDFDRGFVFLIEAKNLRQCRNEGEAVARMSDYRGEMRSTKNGDKPDKLLKHLNRVAYLRKNRARLCSQLGLPNSTQIKGVVVVETPQPMNFHNLNDSPDADFVSLDGLPHWLEQVATT